MTIKSQFEIRLLPMSKLEFKTLNECVYFLTKVVPNRGNTYYYRRRNLKTPTGSLILFQYSGNIIGYTTFLNDRPLNPNDNIDYTIYNGCYTFNENPTILNTFITGKEIKEKFGITLGQGAAKIPTNLHYLILDMINNKK